MSFDSTCGDYKILKISQDKAPSEILVLKSGSWRIIDEHPSDRIKTLAGRHSLSFIHGAFHWVSFTRNSYFVVSFNISHEMYGEMPLPKEVWLYNVKIGISVLDGMLCAYSNRFANGEMVFWCEHVEYAHNEFRTQRGPFILPRGILQNGFAFTEIDLSKIAYLVFAHV
ncbi:hypothetical protein CQW23_29704 [Capsicum baccatum]|uniref:F-box associated beta-propeller type 1 domain-containing protein n=1 Tax=Capsicum baccatum TaxID=33114 RepID=A0A2G2VCH4_CAPBA|nr:hypothetical protein CQW23_29704 [Capsicum baccatum]